LAWYCPESNNVLITGPARRERDATKKVEKVIASVGFSKDGRKLAVAFDDYSVQVLDSDDGKPHSTMRGHTGPIPGIHFSQDGRFLATASYDSTARVWDVESGQEVAMVAVPGRQLTGVTFSLDGLSLLLRSSSSVLLWRCYACGDTTTLLNEARQRNIVRPLARDEQRRFGLSNGLSSGTPAR
jgi:WD40 repeat protein